MSRARSLPPPARAVADRTALHRRGIRPRALPRDRRHRGATARAAGRRQRRRRQQRVVRRGRLRDAEDRRARRDLPRRPRAAGARADRRQVDAAGRLGRRQRHAELTRSQKEIEQESGFTARVRQARRRVRSQQAQPPAVPVPLLEGVLHLRDHRRRGAHQLRDDRRRVLRARRAAGAVDRPRDRRADPPHVRAPPASRLPTEFD